MTYTIVVAPLTTPLDADSVASRARQIGALVGLNDVIFTGPGDSTGTWMAWFAQAFDGVAVEQGSVELDLRSDGTVERFVRTIGPRAPQPATLITEAQAEKAADANAKPASARLEWAKFDTDTFHLVWWFHFGAPGSAERELYVDAGTGKILFSAVIS